MTRYDEVLSQLLRLTQATPSFKDLTRALALRDLQGRLRLVLDGALPEAERGALETALTSQLGAWFVGPVLCCCKGGSAVDAKLAEQLLAKAEGWPAGFSREISAPYEPPVVFDADRWVGLDRVHAKHSWLHRASEPLPWPLRAGLPAIVAFYSFKGGVGRSSALGYTAWQLAKTGRRVVCVDLDLEAPGLSGLFGLREDRDSVLELLLSHCATTTLPEQLRAERASVAGAQFECLPAGRLDNGYLSRLARLDYVSHFASPSPVHAGLKALLKKMKSALKPDYILLDCRAGLHDLGGIALTELAHVSVLVGRDTPQGREGLSLALGALARQPPEQRRVLIAQTFVPKERELRERTVSRFKAAMRAACEETLYQGLPDPGDQDVPHDVVALDHYQDLLTCQRLDDLERLLPTMVDYQVLVERIQALAEGEG